MNKIKKFVSDIGRYWNTPPKGRYINYKEILSLAVGGFGVRLVFWCVNQMIISVGNTLIGNTIGINPSALYVIYILSVLSSIPLTVLRAKMIDNSRSMKGKYRPYILSMGIPTAILGIGFVLIPYENMSLFWKCFFVLLFNIGFQFFYNFYFDAYQSIINVLSPNTIERSDVQSVRSVIENLSPSVAGIFMPLVAKAITGENTLYDIRIFRILFPVMLIIGVSISILIYVNNEEKIVQAKTHIIQISFFDALKSVAGNKYFWIISLAGWLGFLEGSFASILSWMYNYQHACSPGQYSLIVAITGNASLWSTLVVPFLVRKIGKRKILVVSNLLNVVFILLMLPIVKMTGTANIIWALVFIVFLNQFLTSIGNILSVSINADIRDYQQYITGERIDGMFATVSLIGTIVTLATSFVLPAIYEKAGLNVKTALLLGFDGNNVYDVLFNHDYFIRICTVLILASVVGALLNAIPFFFYDLTETKQKAMVDVLKIRSMFEDYANHVASDETISEVVEIIKDAQNFETKEKHTFSKADFVGMTRKEARRQRIKFIEENEKIEISQIVMEELRHFETQEGMGEVELAKRIVGAGLDYYINVELPTRQAAKALPKATQSEKDYRRNMLMLISKMKAAEKAINKYFPNGIEVFDMSLINDLFKTEDKIENELHILLYELKCAKESKNKEKAESLKIEIKEINQKKKEIQKRIKAATDKNRIYYRAAKPYLDARKTLERMENYSHLYEILEQYDKSNGTAFSMV